MDSLSVRDTTVLFTDKNLGSIIILFTEVIENLDDRFISFWVNMCLTVFPSFI